MPEQGVPLAPPILGRSANPIPTGEGQIMPTNYYWYPKMFSPSSIPDLNSLYDKYKKFWDPLTW